METNKGSRVKVTPVRKENGTRQYSNYVRVISNPFDLTLQFADVKPAVTEDEQEKINKKKEIHVPIDTEIILPKEVAQALSEILNKHLSGIIKRKGNK